MGLKVRVLRSMESSWGTGRENRIQTFPCVSWSGTKNALAVFHGLVARGRGDQNSFTRAHMEKHWCGTKTTQAVFHGVFWGDGGLKSGSSSFMGEVSGGEHV